jgi:hypothetical protein
MLSSDHVFDLFEKKAQHLPPGKQFGTLYVRPGQMPPHVVPTEWKLVGRAYHPSIHTIRDVEARGYCERYLSDRVDPRRFYPTMR